MAYTKQTWTSGETVTSAKLNHMEDGIAEGAALIVEAIYDSEHDSYTLDKTWQEIFNAYASGGCVIHQTITGPMGTGNIYYLVDKLNSVPSLDGSSLSYGVFCVDYSYTCASPNDYPTDGGESGGIG